MKTRPGATLRTLAVWGVATLLAVTGGAQAQGLANSNSTASQGIRGLAVHQSASTLSSPMAVKRSRASLSASAQRAESGKVVVSASSNARKVKVTYRTSKNRKRSATIKIREGSGVRTLAKGSKRIYVQTLKTKSLRASRRIPIRIQAWSPSPGNPGNSPTGSPATLPLIDNIPGQDAGDGGISPTYFRLTGPPGTAPAAAGFICPAPVNAQTLSSS